MVSETAAAAVEYHDNLGIDALEDSQSHAVVARSGGLLTPMASLNRSLCPKLLGSLLVAQQFTTASAAGLCQALNSVQTTLDLIGLISTFGPEAATKSLSFSALNDDWRYFTGHIGPGSLGVAAVLFEATGFSVAHLFAFGGTADAYQLTRLDCPQGLRYIGMKSHTECPVGNAVGACVVRQHQELWKGRKTSEQKELSHLSVKADVEIGRHVGRDAKRQLKVITLRVGRIKDPRLVKLKSSTMDFLLLGWLPLLLTVGLIITCVLCKERFVAVLISLGTLGMSAAVCGLRLAKFQYPESHAAKDAPEGNCLVVDDTDPETLHIILGQEDDIQTLFQRNIAYEPSYGKIPLFLAGSMLYAYVIISVLHMSNVSVRGQILFAIANLIGLVIDMVKASKNGQLGMARKACQQFNIRLTDSVVFRNRTAAVAYVAKHTDYPSMLRSKKLLPSDGPVWGKWWDELSKRSNEDTTINMDPAAQPNDELLHTLVTDMNDGLNAYVAT